MPGDNKNDQDLGAEAKSGLEGDEEEEDNEDDEGDEGDDDENEDDDDETEKVLSPDAVYDDEKQTNEPKEPSDKKKQHEVTSSASHEEL